jgi:hypothetical protein
MEIYGLFTLTDSLYLHAVSYNEKNLENIINKDIDYIIRKLSLYSISKTYNDKLLFSKVLSYKNDEKIYGIILCKSNEIGLLKVTHSSDIDSTEYKIYLDELRKTKIFEDNKFSLETVKFDIMNTIKFE